MELLELILFLLVAVVASSLLDQVLHGVSLPLVQIILGCNSRPCYPVALLH